MVFARRALDDMPLQAARFGIPSQTSLEQVEVRELSRSDDPQWFDGWRGGAIRSIAEHDLGDELSTLDAADRAWWVGATLKDPEDFGYLQTSWALARWLVARGANVVLDAHAAHFWRGADVAARPADEPFDVRREVTLILETEATEPNEGHCLHTRGLRKLGCPDLIAVIGPEDAELVSEIFWQLAEGLAHGFEPALPRHGVDLPDGRSLYLCPPRSDDPAEKLELNNDALMLVREDGASLVGLSRDG